MKSIRLSNYRKVVVAVITMVLAVSLWALLGQQAKPAQAQTSGDTVCSTASPLLGGTYENIVVPAWEQCQLHDAQVSGAVTVLEDARLQASNNTIGGTVRGIDRTGGG
jgi:hypothetical protein